MPELIGYFGVALEASALFPEDEGRGDEPVLEAAGDVTSDEGDVPMLEGVPEGSIPLLNGWFGFPVPDEYGLLMVPEG